MSNLLGLLVFLHFFSERILVLILIQYSSDWILILILQYLKIIPNTSIFILYWSGPWEWEVLLKYMPCALFLLHEGCKFLKNLVVCEATLPYIWWITLSHLEWRNETLFWSACQSTINIWKKVPNKAIWANQKWAGFW